MKLVFIYGPPAVGKLTVAQGLATLTGFRLFHNHLTVDLVTSIFERGMPSYGEMVWRIRFAILEEAARVNIDGLIFTMVYATSRKPRIDQCIDVVERHDGRVCFVHLHCARATLEKRVVSDKRRKYGKITTIELLNETLDRMQAQQPFSTIPGQDSLSIDTSDSKPGDVVHRIISHYELSKLATE